MSNGRSFGAMAIALAMTASAQATPNPASRDPGRADVYAVIVGFNGGRPGLPTLQFADDDAVRFSLLLAGLAEGNQEKRISLLTDLDADTQRGLAHAGLRAAPDGPPTRTALLAAFDTVRRALAARPADAGPSTFYFIYAGHGLHGRLLLEPEAGSDAAITGFELRAAVADLAKVAPTLRAFVFLDACRSQSLFTERGSGAELGPDLSAEVTALDERARTVRIGVLTAAFSGRPAGEVRALGAGYFSHVLASGLAGAADADGDEIVSFAELAAFVAYNTLRLTAQRPWFSPPAGDLTAPVVDLRGGRTRLELSSAPAGRYLVQAAGGRPIFAEAVKGERRPLRLTLPAGRYRVLRAVDREPARATDVELLAGVPLDLSKTTWRDAMAVAPTVARGGADDAAPNGASASADADLLDAATPAFGSAFTPEAVSTLTAAYAAGREPPSAARSFGHALGIAATLGSAPVGLAGVEPGIALRYRRRLGRFFAGASVAFGRSSHTADTTFRLDRFTALLEAGPRWSWMGRLELGVSVAAGGGPLVRRGSDGAVSGDAFAPLLAATAGAEVRLEGRWSLYLEARYSAQWVSVDGSRRRAGGPVAQAGLAWGF